MSKTIPTIQRDAVFQHLDFPLGINWNCGHPDYPLHRHDFSELVIVQQGTGTNSVDRIDYPLQAGDVFVMPSGRTHAYHHMDHLRSYNIYFDFKPLHLDRWVTRSLPGFQALFVVEPSYRRKNEFNSRLRLNPEQLFQIWNLAEMLQQALKEEQPGYRLIALGKFMELVGMLCRFYEETPHSSDAHKVLRIAKAISHVETHFTDEITTEQLADIAHMSPRNFHRVFVDATSQTPTQYLITLRINDAARLLKNSDLSITEIAFECGFTDSNYFTRQFKKQTGQSPAAFRKKTRLILQSLETNDRARKGSIL
jgi:AraC-like DNA-binding protein